MLWVHSTACCGCTGQSCLPLMLTGMAEATEDQLVGRAGNQPNCHSCSHTKEQGLLPAQPAKRHSCRNCGCTILWGCLLSSLEQESLCVVPVLAEPTCLLWQFMSCFGRIPPQMGCLDGLGPQRNAGVGHTVLARQIENVRSGSCKPLALQAGTGEGREMWLPSILFPVKSVSDPCPFGTCLRSVNKSPSHIAQALFKLLLLCCIRG